jgi:FKBP-type peptidyl-prolyl cis-trans isomerase
MRILILFFSLGFALSSCNKEKKQAEADEKTILDYMSAHGLTGKRTDSGVYVIIEEPGIGSACGSASTVEVAYTGYFTNDEVFDSSTSATFNLSNVIEGWQIGIPYFREGGHGKLLIPSGLAYGPQGKGSIPGNTVLIFDVELIDIL